MTSDKLTPPPALEQGAPLDAPLDALRQLVTLAVQDALHHEFDTFLGAQPYERADSGR